MIEFRHRRNNDETWDSICMTCYSTAGASDSEQGLSEMEIEHQCHLSIGGNAQRLTELLLAGGMPRGSITITSPNDNESPRESIGPRGGKVE
jgi:hypothetical protein